MNEREAIGRRVRELRRQQGLSLERLAAVAQVTTSYLGSIERGSRNATVDTLSRVALALGVSLAELVAGEGLSLSREVEALIADIPSRERVQALAAIRESLRLLHSVSQELARVRGVLAHKVTSAARSGRRH